MRDNIKPLIILIGVFASVSLFAQGDTDDKTSNLLYPSYRKKKDNINKPKLDERSYIQGTDRFKLRDRYKTITLSGAIEQGLRANYNQIDRKHEKEVLEIDWTDTKDGFWLPQLKLTLSSSEQRMARLRRGRNNTQPNDRIPTGTLALELGEYTVFNWGKDYLAYLNSRDTYLQGDRNLKEKRRSLKHDIIKKYFEVLYYSKVYEARKQQLRHASFVYRYNREKVSLRKVGRQEYYQGRAEYLQAQNDFREAKVLKELADEQLSWMISDTPGTRYLLGDDLNYRKLSTTYTEAIALGAKNNPSILDAETSVKNAKRTHEITLKENLPLPKFSINLGAYTHTFNSANHTTRYETYAGDSNLDIVATVSASWAITGPGGLFNQRKTDRSMFQQYRAFNSLAQKKHQNKSNIQTHYYNIKNYEEQIKILEAREVTVQKTFDSVLENYLNRKTAYLNFQDALLDMTQTDILLAKYRFLHTATKVSLATELGVDDFPGDNFETMGVKKAGK